MSMLTVNEEQMEVFGQALYLKLKAEIDKMLTENISDWQKLRTTQKENWIDFLIIEGNNAQLKSNSDHVEFAKICMSSDEGCEAFLERGDVKNILLDKYVGNGRKLILLSKLTKII